ncbi:MAG: BatA domain-containing protein [Cytophagales bacterium]|nr:BatA domain-containing protein [Bernardetiaceae bacterium]MDW8203769.1 BatA domain-containing protein [Cytophagales bacterium]
MSFLYPSFLWALVLVVVPIVIHLFNFQRPKVVYFTNVAFLREVQLVANARNRLKHLLILLMRCLFVVALVIAFAQPFIPYDRADNLPIASNQAAIYIDNSFSMQNERDGKKLLDRSVDFALQIVKGFPQNARFSVLNNSFENDLNFLFEPAKANDLISKTDYSNVGRTLESVYERQKNILANLAGGGSHHIFWLTDFQHLPNSNLEKLAAELDSVNRFYLLPQQANDVSNVYVDSVWLENPFVRVNESNTLRIKLRHFGTEPATERLVRLFIEGKQVSGGTISLQPSESAELALNFAVTSSGQKPCKVVVEDTPVIFDNNYYFTLNVAPQINILHIVEGKGSPYVPNVYANEPFFKVESVGVGSLDYARINAANVVILQGLKNIDSSLQTALRNFLVRGGALAIFPGQVFDAQSYSALLGLRVVFMPDALSTATPKLSMNPPDLQAPFFKDVFEKINEQMAMPEAKVNLTWSGTGKELLSLRNGQPYLTVFELFNSTVFLFASPLDLAFTELPQNALFVPIMYKIALAGRRSGERLAYSFAEPLIALPLAEGQNFSRNDVLKLVPVDSLSINRELIPVQRFADNQLIIELPKTELPAGNYNLVQRKNNNIVASLALNYDKAESQFKTYTIEELKRIFAGKKNVQVLDEVSAREFTGAFNVLNLNKPLWRYFIIAALLFLLIEVLLIRFWKS